MARNRKSKREESIYGSLASVTFFISLYLTKSIETSIIITIVIFAITIAIILYRKFKYTERLKKSGINEIDKMDGIEFEHYLDHLFKSLGYHSKVTKAVGDYGADLILTKDGRKIVVQAKRHNKNIGIEAVQQIHSSLNHYGADEAWVICNKDYTEAARNLAKSNHVRLIGREELIEIILQTNGISEETKEPSRKSITCERCGNPMVLRTGPRGEFYGCSSFPKCRNTKQISKINEA